MGEEGTAGEGVNVLQIGPEIKTEGRRCERQFL